MSSVGNGGKGESVWLTWFMCDILEKLIPICERRGDSKGGQKPVRDKRGFDRSGQQKRMGR